MESPVAYPESPMDGDDVFYPCKGCGQILEEGKAFELAGNRWHIDCFRCNSCGTLLDSDANLLLLGDGSLICNNCTYSCSACGNKIEDLAILTGDQAFCSSCFRCRNCKRKIENLRYARTSQGIFCMTCHESLMARRRKKTRATPKPPSSNGAGMEKALPLLPADSTRSIPGGTSSDGATHSPRAPSVTTPPELARPETRSPRERQTRPRNESINASSSFMRDPSPPSVDDPRKRGFADPTQSVSSAADGPTLPASTYSGAKSNPSTALQLSDDDDENELEGFLPMAFDPTPIAAPSIPRKPAPQPADLSPPLQVHSENRAPRDYFGNSGRLSANRPGTRDELREEPRSVSSRSVSAERETERPASKTSSHILSQDKGRLAGGRMRDTSTPTTPAPAVPQDKTLRSPPLPIQQPEEPAITKQSSLHRKGVSASVPSSPALASSNEHRAAIGDAGVTSQSPTPSNPRNSGINPFDDPKRKDPLPLRADSLNAAGRAPKASSQDLSSASHKRHPSTSAAASPYADAQTGLSRDSSRAKPTDPSANRSSFDALPPRSSSRPDPSSKLISNDEFSAPRTAPPAPPVTSPRVPDLLGAAHVEDRRSVEGQPSPGPRSTGLPKYTTDGSFSMEDEMGRILRGEKREGGDAVPSSVLRRVSNAVKHGRNFSEREPPRPSKSPVNGGLDISSPLPISTPSVSSPTPTTQSQESVDQVRASLRRAQVQIAELETDKIALLEQLNGSSEIKAVNTELREKRSTMAILDSQREMIVRELEIMTDHLSKAKDNREPLDLASLKTSMLREFAESLQKLKDSMGLQIEDLIRKRNELTEEITTLIQMKDKGFQEYEALSNRNAQLLQHNTDVLRRIQGVYQDNRNPTAAGGTNGLGIYNSGKADGSTTTTTTTTSSDMRDFRAGTESSLAGSVAESELEPAVTLNTPQVLTLRKGAKPTKFNWRRGGESLAKNVSKGLKGAFAADRMPPPSRDGAGSGAGIGVPYSATQSASVGGGGSDYSSPASTRAPTEDSRVGNGAGFGFFNQKNGVVVKGKDGSNGHPASTDGSVLFGSELQARCDYENRVIPGIVSRCIQEVEARGMDVEGIYRKSGGAGQVKSVQQAFERDANPAPTSNAASALLSDPDLEIHAVTSALKQYFRKLPTPLITYDVYDSLLEAGQMFSSSPSASSTNANGPGNGGNPGSDAQQKQVVALKLAVHALPDAHRDCLQVLVQHLARVMAHDAHNLMTALNLAVVFAPTIMRPMSIEREMTDMQTQRAAVQALLENHRSVFPE